MGGGTATQLPNALGAGGLSPRGRGNLRETRRRQLNVHTVYPRVGGGTGDYWEPFVVRRVGVYPRVGGGTLAPGYSIPR